MINLYNFQYRFMRKGWNSMRAAFPIHLLAIYTNYLFTNYFILETQNVSQSTTQCTSSQPNFVLWK